VAAISLVIGLARGAARSRQRLCARSRHLSALLSRGEYANASQTYSHDRAGFDVLRGRGPSRRCVSINGELACDTIPRGRSRCWPHGYQCRRFRFAARHVSGCEWHFARFGGCRGVALRGAFRCGRAAGPGRARLAGRPRTSLAQKTQCCAVLRAFGVHDNINPLDVRPERGGRRSCLRKSCVNGFLLRAAGSAVAVRCTVEEMPCASFCRFNGHKHAKRDRAGRSRQV